MRPAPSASRHKTELAAKATIASTVSAMAFKRERLESVSALLPPTAGNSLYSERYRTREVIFRRNALEVTMQLERTRIRALVCCGLVLLVSASANANGWIQKNYKVNGGGTIEFEFPDTWGKKPRYEKFDTITDIQLGPYGPKSKPVFLFQLQAVLSSEAITDADLMEVTRIEIAKIIQIAFETEVPINEIEGPNVAGRFFSITDQSSKRGEFDYLTMAVMGSGKLLIKCYFFSSDGAPDFGADALQMMESIKYTAPVPKPKKK